MLRNITGKAILTLTLLFTAITASAQPGKEARPDKVKSVSTKGTVYVFGVGDSMRDSTVFITSVQRIDNANIQKRTKFLLDRSYFSMQLKAHFTKTINDPNRLCIIYTFNSEKKATKKMLKVRKQYLDEGAVTKQLMPGEFQFTPMDGAVYQSAGENIDPAFSQPSEEE